MDWWQFAALTGTCVGTGLAALAVLRYKVEELRRVDWETWAASRNQITGRRDGLVVSSSAYHPRLAWELPRRSDVRYKVADLGYKVAGLQREQTDLRREQQTLRQGLAEVRGYLRGLNL